MKITDEKLYELCVLYGERARLWRQKFAGLLPEVFRRRLYIKKGFGSIYEFAAKLAGMSEEQVSRVLNLEKKFEAAPILKNMLEKGEVSVNKLARVASVVTAENQEFWAAQVKLLPQQALETLIRDEKFVRTRGGLQENTLIEQFVRAHTNPQQNLQNATRDPYNGELSLSRACRGESLYLSSQVMQKLLELQQKGIDVNKLLLEFLEKRELEIAQEKEKISVQAQPTSSRYIPVTIRKLLKKEHGEKCSIKNCQREACIIHHTQRFALAKIHDPKYLAPLCEEHHKIAHTIDMKFHEKVSHPP